MIRVVDLEFGRLSTANLRIFRSAGLRTGWGRPVCIFFKKWEPDAPSIRFTISKKKNESIYVISWRAVMEWKNYMGVQEEGMGVEEEFVFRKIHIQPKGGCGFWLINLNYWCWYILEELTTISKRLNLSDEDMEKIKLEGKRSKSTKCYIEYLSQNWVGQLGIKFRTLTRITH